MLRDKGFVFVILMSLSWALNVVLAGYVFSKGAVPYVYGYQTLIFCGIIMMFYIMLKKKNKPRYDKSSIPLMILFGVIANGIGNYFGLEGIKSSATNYGFLIKMSIVFIITLEIIFTKTKITKTKILFAIFMIFGAFLISTKGKIIVPVKGDFYTLISSFCFALVIVFSKKINIKNSPEYLSVFRSFAGGVSLLLISLYFGYDIIQSEFLFLAFVGGALVFALFIFMYSALELKSASYVSMISMSFSVMTAILSYFILGEKMNIIQILGGVVIIITIVLMEKFKES